MIVAITPEIPWFSPPEARDSSPSRLAYSLREECFPELNTEIRSFLLVFT